MAMYTQVATILQKTLGQKEGLLVLEYFETRLPPDVARQRDVSKAETALRLEIERVRADLTKEIETVRADLTKEIETVRLEVEKVRADLTIQIARSQATQTRWAFLFWISQMAVLLGLLFRLLPGAP